MPVTAHLVCWVLKLSTYVCHNFYLPVELLSRVYSYTLLIPYEIKSFRIIKSCSFTLEVEPKHRGWPLQNLRHRTHARELIVNKKSWLCILRNNAPPPLFTHMQVCIIGVILSVRQEKQSCSFSVCLVILILLDMGVIIQCIIMSLHEYLLITFLICIESVSKKRRLLIMLWPWHLQFNNMTVFLP